MSSVYIYIEGNGTPLQYVCLQNPMDRGAWWAAVHGVTKSWTWLSDFPFTFHFHALEKEMATHSSDLAWRIPGTEEPGGPLSMGSHRVGHNWSDLAAAYTYIHTYIHTYIYAHNVLNLCYPLQYILNQSCWKVYQHQEWLLTAVTSCLSYKPECLCPLALSFLTHFSEDSSACCGSRKTF